MFVVIALLFSISCQAASTDIPVSMKDIPGTPEDPVKRFYTAIEKQDCAAFRAQLSVAYLERWHEKGLSCDEIIKQLSEYPLAEVIRTSIDGRNPQHRLVKVRMVGNRGDVIVRVIAEGGQWKIDSM